MLKKYMKSKIKVIAYIFRNNQKEILVFDHRDYPEVGTQVVGGTVESGEDFLEALKREVFEESGLVVGAQELLKINETTYLRKDREEINYRHYYRLDSDSYNLPSSWTHIVQSTGEDNSLAFTFYWLKVDEAKRLLDGNFGESLP